ncbi:glutathione peroxidase [Lacinutrix neustonica]|uniref:Glutathione peroxidase n=1 Tax=Lacinutrix neustonica TaxID=2980107 RepID=A0A9E8MYA6_9FLAO|nr:glutathione peroxidase [Lacinutrix neustonica]WAC03130.1 glutathione peroxidase [Lacinutrix neustonica]
MNPFQVFFKTFFTKPIEATGTRQITSIYDIKIRSLNGKAIDLSDFKNKHVLFVNVASKCGFTPQYKQLQELSDTYKDTLMVIGVPCNQFGKQEPGNAKEIETFCEVNYGVTFLITEKIDVKGHEIHPLYQWLTQKSKNGSSNSSVKWNFQKYLVDGNGVLKDYFYSATTPLSKKITKYL